MVFSKFSSERGFPVVVDDVTETTIIIAEGRRRRAWSELVAAARGGGAARGPWLGRAWHRRRVRLFVREIRDHKAQADISGGGHPQNLTVRHRPSGIDENMVYQTPEELAEYEDIIQRTFGSEAEGYEFFNSFAKSKGFSLRKGNIQYLENKDNIYSRQFLCSKEGFRSAKNLNREDRQRRPRPMTRFSCSFEVVIKHNPEMNLWFVHKYIDAHNHEMATSKEVGASKKEILDYQTAGLRKYQIVDVMEQQYGGNVGHVLRDHDVSILDNKNGSKAKVSVGKKTRSGIVINCSYSSTRIGAEKKKLPVAAEYQPLLQYTSSSTVHWTSSTRPPSADHQIGFHPLATDASRLPQIRLATKDRTAMAIRFAATGP
ncbi:hypothetical protein EJB05_03317, partial [Eragrostis curvula]